MNKAQAGYSEKLSVFSKAEVRSVVNTLKQFVSDAGDSQIRAWRDSVRILQDVAIDLIGKNPKIGDEGAILRIGLIFT